MRTTIPSPCPPASSFNSSAPRRTATSPIVVKVLDADGNPAPESTPVTLSILTGPDKAKISGNPTANTVDGVATFDNIGLSVGGDYVLQAQANDLTVDSDPFTVGGPS